MGQIIRAWMREESILTYEMNEWQQKTGHPSLNSHTHKSYRGMFVTQSMCDVQEVKRHPLLAHNASPPSILSS